MSAEVAQTESSHRSRWLRAGVLSGKLALFALGVAALFQVAGPPVYEFPPPRPFEGSQWYDPYAGGEGAWLRTNFHAHARVWGGITYGTSSHEMVRERYRELGYDVYSISDYQRISRPAPGDGVPIPAYEHGLNVGGQHQLVVGARRVSWFDLPLLQGLRQKQNVLDHLRRDAPAVIINHATKRGSYTLDDMARLSGYTGLEIATKYIRSRAHWDAALSAGHPVWGFCSDDGHRYEIPRHAAIGWIMVRSADRAPASVLESIRTGRFYGVWTRHHQEPNALRSAALRDDILTVAFERPADEIRFVGQGGRTLAVVREAASGSYRLEPEDTYVRTEAVTGDTTLFLNPVFRHSGAPLAQPAPAVAWVETSAVRAGALGALGILLVVLFMSRSPRESSHGRPLPAGNETARSLPPAQ